MTSHRARRFFLLLLVCVSLGGCAMRVAYHFLDVALLWSLDDYIDFDRSQRAHAKQVIKALHEWHRYHELPKYAEQLDALADDLGSEISVDRLRARLDESATTWRTSMAEIGRSSASILIQLSDAQIQGLVDTMAEEEAEDIEAFENETPAEVRDERYEFMSGALRRLVGRLNREQKLMIMQWSWSLHDMGKMSLHHRKQWREHFTTIVTDRSDLKQLQTALAQLFSAPYLTWSEGYQGSMEHNKQLTQQLLTDLANSLNGKQRQKAIARLRNLAGDCRALSQGE